MIDNFKGKYAFLSNFYNVSVYFDGVIYQNNEAAFQSAKVDQKDRWQFRDLDPSSAKKLGRKVKLRHDWESVKDDMMYQIVKEKFIRHNNLKQKLLDTGNEDLVEGNSWNDTYWGVCRGKGKNMLGKILMRVREELK